MNLRNFLFGFLLLLAPVTFAQDQIEPFPFEPIESIFLNDSVQEVLDRIEQQKSSILSSDNISIQDKILLTELADIYRIHVLSLESQINNDALSTEKYIMEAINRLQVMLEENAEIKENRRFTELYRTVMSEYQEFYGISNKSVEGEIFKIQEELFSETEEGEMENYALPKSITTPKTQVPLIQNRYVNNHISYLWMKRPEITETWLKRKEVYFPMMEKIFKEEGAPLELMHLAMIESGLNPNARSWAAAVGMWQFIRATGSVYGLEVNWWVDERRDPVKATRAAARHLRDLYNVWGDWHLALANYNVSPRRLKRAIAYSGGVKDYWVIYPYLPRETRGYVPSFIAATMIAQNPVEFGFQENYGGVPYSYETAEVTGSIELKTLAECAGISLDEMKEYNPELIRWATPPGDEPYPLKLPVGVKERFVENLKKLPPTETRQLFIHTVKRGETLGRIANKYGTTVRDLYLANGDLKSMIYPNQQIVIPVPQSTGVQILADRPSNSGASRVSRSRSRSTAAQPKNTTALTYKVKKGDTIGHIAEWYGTRASNVRAWNNTSNTIRVGEKLTLYVPNAQAEYYKQMNTLSFTEKQRLKNSGGAKRFAQQANTAASGNFVTYTVQKNDNLSKIASSFNTTISELRKLNNLRGSRIYVGQTLKVKKK